MTSGMMDLMKLTMIGLLLMALVVPVSSILCYDQVLAFSNTTGKVNSGNTTSSATSDTDTVAIIVAIVALIARSVVHF